MSSVLTYLTTFPENMDDLASWECIHGTWATGPQILSRRGIWNCWQPCRDVRDNVFSWKSSSVSSSRTEDGGGGHWQPCWDLLLRDWLSNTTRRVDPPSRTRDASWRHHGQRGAEVPCGVRTARWRLHMHSREYCRNGWKNCDCQSQIRFV